LNFIKRSRAQSPLLFLVILLAINFAGSIAAADSVRGFIKIEAAQVYLLPVSNEILAERLSITTSLQIRSALLDLKTGDYVVVTGTLSNATASGIKDQISVDAIESVGLSDLLGTWRNANGQVIRFESFNSAALYRQNIHFGSAEPTDFAKYKDLSYSLAPEHGSAYSIFLAEKHSPAGSTKLRGTVYVGRIRLQGDALTIEFFDPNTGGSTQVLTLSPVRD
jgi:hypothetical protein